MQMCIISFFFSLVVLQVIATNTALLVFGLITLNFQGFGLFPELKAVVSLLKIFASSSDCTFRASFTIQCSSNKSIQILHRSLFDLYNQSAVEMLAPSENLDCWKKALTFQGWIREFFSRFTSISIVDSPFGSAVFILVQFVNCQIPYSYCSNLITTSLK